MNKKALKDHIRDFYDKQPGKRLWFIIEEFSHAWTNIFREAFRYLRAPDAAPGERNCADNISLALAILIPIAVVIGLVVI